MPNLPYSSTDWTTTRQRAPKAVAYPFLSGESPDRYARVIRRFYEGTSFTPTLADRTSWSNLLLHSADLSNAAWTKSDSTAAANILANPWDGTVTASRMLEAATTAPHAVTQAYTFTAVQHTYMAIVRGGLGRNWVMLRAAIGASTWDCFFNVNAGTVGTASGATGSMVALGDGWYLCILVFTPTSGAGTVQLLASTDGSTLSYAGNTANGFYLGNAQLALTGADGPLIITTSTTRTVSAPPTDRSQNSSADALADPFAYLVEESSPEPAGPGGLVRWSRTYARIPASQTSFSARLITRPVMNDIKSGSSFAVTFDEGVTSHRFTSRIGVSSVGAVTQAAVTVDRAAESITDFSTGTFTVGDTGGASVSPSFTSTASSIEFSIRTTCAAITGLAVSKGIGTLTISWTGGVRSIGTTQSGIYIEGSAGSGSVTFRVASAAVTAAESEIATGPTRVLTSSSAHSGSAGEWVALWNGDRLVAVVKAVAASGSSVTIPADTGPLAVASLALTHLAFAGQAAARYVNGPVSVTVQDVSSFSLPGVSTGITTAADIALVAPKLDPVSWLGEIVAASTYAAVEGSQLEQWNGWGIYRQRTVSAQMSDALDTVAVGA